MVSASLWALSSALSEWIGIIRGFALQAGSKIGKSTEAMNIEPQEWQAWYVLDALRALEHQWQDIAAHSDEETAPDLGNEMMLLTVVHYHFECEAVKAFGPTVTNFQVLPLAPPKLSKCPSRRREDLHRSYATFDNQESETRTHFVLDHGQ
jgi:hypothetical protein